MCPARKQSDNLIAVINSKGMYFYFPSSETFFRCKHKNTNNLGTKLIIEKMVFALVGEHVPSSQTKIQLDRTAKLRGDVNFFSFLRDSSWINTKIRITWEEPTLF